MWRCCHRVLLCLGKVFQSLSALGPHVTCFVALEALSPTDAFRFLGRFVLHILGLVFALEVLAFASALFALAFALRVHSELHWHWLTVDVLLCSRDLENLLLHLIPACDSDAVPDEVLFHSHVLHPQHRHSYLDVVVYGLCGLVLVVVYGSLERCQLGRNVVSESVHQHVHQESHIPRPTFGFSFHHELPPGLEPFVHTGIVTLVQRGSCSRHHQNVVHLFAEFAFLAR